MSVLERFCPDCGREVSIDWNKPFCKYCGARIRTRISGSGHQGRGRERFETRAHRDAATSAGAGRIVLSERQPRWGAPAEDERREPARVTRRIELAQRTERARGFERPDWVELLRKTVRRTELGYAEYAEEARAKKRYKAERRTGKENEERRIFEGVAIVSGFGPARRSPFLLLIFNVLSLGLCSTFFTWHYLYVLNLRVREEERLKASTVYAWLFSYIAALATAGWAGLDYAETREGVAYLISSYKPALCALYGLFCVVLNRHLLWWAREAFVEAIYEEREQKTRVRPEVFASSYIWLWYLGLPYLQLHINRAIGKGRLQSQQSRRRRRRWSAVEDSSGEEGMSGVNENEIDT